jgi:hypothetical protein
LTRSGGRANVRTVRRLSFAAVVTVAVWLAWERPWRRPLPPSTALDALLPEAEFRDTCSRRVQAPPAIVLRALREVTVADMPAATAIAEVRYLPARLLGRVPPSTPDAPFFDLLLSERGGYRTLAEDPGREVVIGTVGRLHDLVDQELTRPESAEAFRQFAAPVHEKLGMSLRVEDVDATGCTLVLEHRTQAVDTRARRLFSLYWIVIKPGGAFMSQLLLRAVQRRAESAATAAEEP